MNADSDSDGATLPALDTELADRDLPSSPPATSGPEFFEWRRRQWLNSRPKTNESIQPPRDSTSYSRIESVVSTPGYEYNDSIWDTYLKNVNERLKGGVTLRKPLPLWIVIRILHAGWLRDGTWAGPNGQPPPGPISPAAETASPMTETPAMTPTAFVSGLSTPVNRPPAPPTGRIYAARRIRAPGWNSAALEVERSLRDKER